MKHNHFNEIQSLAKIQGNLIEKLNSALLWLFHHTKMSCAGGRMMLQRGVLATNDISKVAKAHVHVYEEMDYGACGRYFCFERVVRRLDEAIQLENNLKMHGQLSGGGNLPSSTQETDGEIQISLSNSKLAKLMLRASQRSSCKQRSLIAA